MDTQTLSNRRDEAIDLLVRHDYQTLAPSVTIGAIPIEFRWLLKGPPNSLNLIAVEDCPTNREGELRLHWKVQRLARALDAASSRRSISLVLVGDSLDARLLGDLQSVARVLIVSDALPVDRLLSPLLPLRVPTASETTLDGPAHLRSAVKGRYSNALRELAAAGRQGPKSVESRYAAWIDDSFTSEDDGV